jgi:Abnormal spindle-like microcephaly-assoc'd, ASPM-SPD-2-Hydin
MPELRSELGTFLCGFSRIGPRSLWKRASLLLVAALASATWLSGCAGLVNSNVPQNPGSPSPSPSPNPQAQLSASPSSASFPNVAIGSNSSQTITVTNSGNATATVSNVAVTGTGFGTAGLALPLTIAAGQSSTFNVTFTASTSGNAAGSISLTSDAANPTLTIPANGSVVAATRSLSSSTPSLNFGDVTLGSSTTLGATLTNTGNADVTISGVAVSGGAFAATGVGANTVLTPGQSAALNTTFAPTASGSSNGAITVASNATTPVSIVLSGNGVQVSSHSVALSWDPSTSDIVGYYVYRQTPTSGFAKLNSAPVVLTEFTDSAVASGASYTYAITAVDADDNESDYSVPVDVVIP